MILTHKKVVNIYIVHEVSLCPFNIGKYFALGNLLFGAVKLMLVMISINILAMILDLMCVEVFYYEMVVGLAKIQ